MELQTARLLLRPFTRHDAQALYEYSREPEVGLHAGWKPHESVAESAEILQTVFLNQPSVWAVIRPADGEMIGSAGLIPDPARENPHTRMLGYALGKPYWGHGYMTEAVKSILQYGFGSMDLSLVSATCYPENARSRRVLQKCGFTYEGTLRQAEVLFNASVQDHEQFSITRAEWQAL